MPLYEFTCSICKLKVPESLFRSFEEAEKSAPACADCGAQTAIDLVFTFASQSFRPFVTQAFNKNPLEKPIEVSDAAQLRRLLRSNRMVDHGCTQNDYFGSDPKSVPTLQEIGKFGRPHDEEAMKKRAKLVKVSSDPVGDKKKLDLAADQTNFGRASSATRPEFVVGRP